MEHHRLRKYRGPETWAMVRQAYIAGESAPSLVRRFDAGYANLRWRARIEGWTRKQIAETLDLKPLRGGADDPRPALMALADLDGLPEPPTVAPREAVARAVRRAAWLVSEGKANEASLLLRAAEALNKLAWAAKG
ncbi:hypothetical protein [Brevundimonas sp.]|jgi:hypothetical protein|uniref:hypothetical protein n=1 Tax=Brevundimonas sp. TaxID=1871086 RepID=UPI0037852BD5